MPSKRLQTSITPSLLVLVATLLLVLSLLGTPLSASADAGGIAATAAESEESGSVGWDDVVTQERVMLLITFGLVVLTWFYLKWRGVPAGDDDPEPGPEERH